MNLSRSLVWLIVWALSVQQALALHVANASVMAAQLGAEDDTILICTGKAMKWVSLSQTESQGRFVFVDPPDDTAVVDCINKVSADVQQALLADLASTELDNSPYPAVKHLRLSAAYPASRYTFAVTRAPPTC